MSNRTEPNQILDRKGRDRRFEAARRKLHYRLRVMDFEHGQHRLTMDHNVKLCETCIRTRARIAMVAELIDEFGGRA